MKTFTNANMFCLDPEKAGPAMIILPLQRAGGLRGPVWCRDGEAGNQIFVNVESLNNSAVQRR